MTTDRYFSFLRAQASQMIAANTLTLGMRPSTAAPVAEAAPDDGSYQVALGPFEKAKITAGMYLTGAGKRFDRTIDRMTNGSFSPEDVKALENRVLDAAESRDVRTLQGVVEGPPVYLNQAQKSVVDKLMGRLGSDPLARRARDAYGKAVDAGQVRTR